LTKTLLADASILGFSLMNRRQLEKLGVPAHCVADAIRTLQNAIQAQQIRGKEAKKLLEQVVLAPETYRHDPVWGELATLLVEEVEEVQTEPVAYRTWGREGIDEASHNQMRQACSVPVAVAGALMPDAHVGYGLPIGGVLACDNAVIPYAVGVDIACRMKLSVVDLPVAALDSKFRLFKEALEKGTNFGVGGHFDRPKSHAVMDRDWNVTRITRERKDKAWQQLGTSGSGNHFVEFGILSLNARDEELGLAEGKYVALLSHSGSRGAGAAVCTTYSSIAQANLPRKYGHYGRLAWLGLDTQPGQEYWQAMNLMGDYAAANHDVIHRSIAQLLGAEIVAGIENHHNFAWKETHHGREMIVHRKGATPAAAGELGVIPGSMATPAFVVRGQGNAESLYSASHGAGRRMSRTQARQQYTWNAVKKDLAQRGVTVLSAGADEVPGVYKDIHQVMREQADLVSIVAQFDPKIVKMCDDGSKAED
jgi:tRNA-splicing ligase RtcB